VSSAPIGTSESASGLGDLNVFNAFLLTKDGARTQIGVGPLLVAPTATADALGAGKWQGGAAVVVMVTPSPTVLIGSLVTYQRSFAGESDRPDTSVLAAQPVVILQFGAGFYARSSAVAVFDLENDTYSVPFGVGAGKVMRAGKSVLNIFVEPSRRDEARRGVRDKLGRIQRLAKWLRYPASFTTLRYFTGEANRDRVGANGNGALHDEIRRQPLEYRERVPRGCPEVPGDLRGPKAPPQRPRHEPPGAGAADSTCRPKKRRRTNVPTKEVSWSFYGSPSSESSPGFSPDSSSKGTVSASSGI
jgi:hypothetical protein